MPRFWFSVVTIALLVAAVTIQGILLVKFDRRSATSGGRINLSVGILDLAIWDAAAFAAWCQLRKSGESKSGQITILEKVYRVLGLVVTAFFLVIATVGIIYSLS